MAKEVWAGSENNSANCRCHQFRGYRRETKDFVRPMHEQFLAGAMTCIDCQGHRARASERPRDRARVARVLSVGRRSRWGRLRAICRRSAAYRDPFAIEGDLPGAVSRRRSPPSPRVSSLAPRRISASAAMWLRKPRCTLGRRLDVSRNDRPVDDIVEGKNQRVPVCLEPRVLLGEIVDDRTGAHLTRPDLRKRQIFLRMMQHIRVVGHVEHDVQHQFVVRRPAPLEDVELSFQEIE